MVISLGEENLLNSLGLTTTQAKVYLSLVYNGPSKVSQISKNSGIHRAHLYQILRSLESTGIVEKNLPDNTFNPMPLKETLEMLIKQKHQEIENLEATAKAISEIGKPELKLVNSPEMMLLTNQKQIIKKFQSVMQRAEKSIYHMHSWTRFIRLWHNGCDDFSDALARGVEIKQIVEIPDDKSQAQNFLAKHVFSNPLFEIRFVPKTVGNFSIIDHKKILLSTSAEKTISDIPPVIKSNYEGLLEVLENCFSFTWESGVTWNELLFLKKNLSP
jgi:sugar-specific transcriptional regulator TrmB